MTEDTLTAWARALAEALDLDVANVDVNALLDVAADAAHGVVRPAAPLTTFLIGYAAGKREASGDDLTAECERASALAREWATL